MWYLRTIDCRTKQSAEAISVLVHIGIFRVIYFSCDECVDIKDQHRSDKILPSNSLILQTVTLVLNFTNMNSLPDIKETAYFQKLNC